jgi:hypothetical protein
MCFLLLEGYQWNIYLEVLKSQDGWKICNLASRNTLMLLLVRNWNKGALYTKHMLIRLSLYLNVCTIRKVDFWEWSKP